MTQPRPALRHCTLTFVLAAAACAGGDAESFARKYAKLACKQMEECAVYSLEFFFTEYGGDIDVCRSEIESEQLWPLMQGCVYQPDHGRKCLAELRSHNNDECGEDDGAAINAACEDVFDCPIECDLRYQDSCGVGGKCIPDGESGGKWDRTKCVSASTGLPGEPCTIRGDGPMNGFYDSCGPTAYCWPESPGAVTGTCLAFCVAWDELECAEAGKACLLIGEIGLPLCLPSCAPSSPTCGAGEACVAASEPGTHVCAPTELPE